MSEQASAYEEGEVKGEVTSEVTGEAEGSGVDDYVAVCPLAPELVAQIVGLADVRWEAEDWWEVSEEAMRQLGWSDDAETELSFMARCVTGFGHHIYEGDHSFVMPFCVKYDVGADLAFTDDEWGKLPGWSSQLGAGHAEFHAHLSAAVDQFARLLGPPELDVTVESSEQPTGRRYAGWRRGGNALLLGQGPEPVSFYGAEEARVFIGQLPADGRFPPAERLCAFAQF
ncbi:hypothetical protein [Streptomyces sp. NPDC015125]|uniref:hypothetical protein n=1 Tax=Streptomyces sp. NPDC015125 TaxID=3364938 RepID=UPI003702E8D2